jgi:hypothetical protein
LKPLPDPLYGEAMVTVFHSLGDTKMKKFNNEGMRMTDCCGACSTYDEEGTLVCKGCYREVEPGQGDGNEYGSKTETRVKPSIRHKVKVK